MKSVVYLLALLLLIAAIGICWGQERGNISSQSENNIDENKLFSETLVKAKNGDPEAQYHIGNCYEFGHVVQKDYREAVKWYLKASEQNYASAQYNLGCCYRDGKGVQQNDQEAFKWLYKSAVLGKANSQVVLGAFYALGRGIPQDYQEAVKWYRKAAEQGDAQAQNSLGSFYYYGNGVPLDKKLAAEWYIKAASQGFPQAQLNLGSMFEKGDGIPRDYKLAAQWYTVAAEQGLAEAQYNLGGIYRKGEGVPQNYKQAAEWYRKAAEQGNAEAQSCLGVMYGEGMGVPQDYKQAAEWYRKAAEQGVAKDQCILGAMYGIGMGVPQDYKQAAEWYRKAAEQGVAEAQCILGTMYWMGQGVIEDFVEAYKWYLLAGMNGIDVNEKKQLLSEKMMPAQIAEAQERAKAFVAKKENASENAQPNNPDAELPKGTGTGFFVHGNGFLITAAHVVEGASKVEIWAGQKKLPAKVLVKDADIDVAILKIEETWTGSVLPITGSGTVKTGDSVFTVGFPNIDLQGTEPKYTEGSISSLTGVANSPRLFQISVAVQPGNSGGPLLDQNGNVVGVVIAKLKAETALVTSGALPENVNYAVKSSFVLPLLETIPDLTAKPKAQSTEKVLERSAIIEQAKASLALVVCY